MNPLHPHKRPSRVWAALALIPVLSACQHQEPSAAVTPESPRQQAVSFSWPVDSAGRLRQIGKYKKDMLSSQNLYPLASFPQGVLPEEDISQLGVEVLTAAEVEVLVSRRGFLLVDVRKDEDVRVSGVIPGSVHLEYRHEGFSEYGSTQLDQESCDALLQKHSGLIFACNGEKCPRSYNACLAAIQLWGVDASRVRWYRVGVPTWNLSPLIPDLALGTENP